MKNLVLIATIGENNELGLDNHQIWNISENLLFYNKMILGENIILGRKTLESMPSSVLIKRIPFILSSKSLDKNYDVKSFSNIFSLIKYIESSSEHFTVVGGASIYEQFLPLVDTMYLTEVIDYNKADKYFPIFNFGDWNIEMIKECHENSIPYIRNKYTRKREK